MLNAEHTYARPVQQTLHIIWKATITFFIPYLLGFLFNSPAELRIWIALRKAVPAPSDDQPSRQSSHGNWHLRLAIPALLILSFLEFIVILKSPLNRPAGRIFLFFLYAGLLLYVTARFASRLCGLDSIVIYRTPDGGYTKQLSGSIREHIGIRILIVLCSVLVILGLFASGDVFSVAVVTMAIVHFVSGSSFGRLPLRKMLKVNGILLLIISFFLALNWFVMRWQDGRYNIVNQNTLWSSRFNEWSRVLFAPTALCSLFPGGLIARMLRFDYQRHLDTSEHAQEVELAIAPPPTAGGLFNRQLNLVEGVIIPHWAPRAFPKPYYILALITWALLHAVLISLFAVITFPTVYLVGFTYLLCAVTLILEGPVIMAVLLFFAYLRKEHKVLWNYHESWTLSPTEGAISLPPPSDVTHQPNENTL